MSDYAFTPYMIPHMIAIIVNVFLMYLVLSRNARARVNQYCVLLLIVITEWIFGVITVKVAQISFI